MVFLNLPAWSEDSLVIYSGRHEKFVKPVMEAFTKQTGIKVKLLNSKSAALINRMRLEGKNTKADLFISNDAGTLQIGADMGLFQPIDEEIVKVVSPKYRGAKNSWVGLSGRARVLVINTKYENELSFIKSVFDLANPKLLGKLGVTHSANSSFIAGITVYQKLAGDKKTLEFLKGLKKNSAGKVYNKHRKIVEDVAAGKKIVGLVNHYYIFRYLKKNPKAPIKMILPDQGEKGMGIAWNVAGIAILKHTRKLEQAKKLVSFLLSEKGQRMFSMLNNEYPVRKGVPTAKGVTSDYKVADVPMSVLGKGRNKALNLIEKVGLY